MDLAWYLKRLRAMSPAEVVNRTRDEAWHQALRLMPRQRIPPSSTVAVAPAPLPTAAGEAADERFTADLVTAADGIVAGRWTALGVARTDLSPAPDWFWDPATGVRSDPDRYAFDVNTRDPDTVGNVKNVWELSRHHHVTILAAAYHLTGHEVYAETAAAQLRSWWDANPFLRGVNWTSGIELGIRLMSWVWTRRLLDGWEGAAALFEKSATFVEQLYGHQSYLARFLSHGSSANNHLIAEEAGRFAAACAFPMFPQSAGWRADAAAALEREIELQTFASGLNRELASDYHGFVAELLLLAATEGDRAGHPLSDRYWSALTRIADAGAAFVDGALREPRQGDGDQGVALALDGTHHARWRSLLATFERVVGSCDWWPDAAETDVRTALWTAGLTKRHVSGRPATRPHLFPDAGVVILRDVERRRDEIWCRADSGPFGYLSIAGHAHADALSVEVRAGGVDILADPGTYSYQVDPEWRSYFRSTRAHNTIEIGGADQAEQAGPFNWATHADAEIMAVAGLDGGHVATWSGRHDGYLRLDPPVGHQRTVTLDRDKRSLSVLDTLTSDGSHALRLAFHLGPNVACELQGGLAALTWQDGQRECRARILLPDQLEWGLTHGDKAAGAGWYSPGLGVRIPVFTLFGVGTLDDAKVLETVIEFQQM